MARGPYRSGVRGWDRFLEITALWAARDRACVRAGDEGVGVVFGMPGALDWVDGSRGEEEGGGGEDLGVGSQYSTTRRAAEKIWDCMI